MSDRERLWVVLDNIDKDIKVVLQDISQFDARVSQLKEDVERLIYTVHTGNGSPGLVTQIAKIKLELDYLADRLTSADKQDKKIYLVRLKVILKVLALVALGLSGALNIMKMFF